MTIQVIIANTNIGYSKEVLVTVVSGDGKSLNEHYHLAGGECRSITIWEGKQLIISEEVPQYIDYPDGETGENG